MRLLFRSATNSRPLESNAKPCGVSNSPGAIPFFPQLLMNFPSVQDFPMRAFESPPCPSATKISPFGPTMTSEGRLKVSGPSPATPALPSVISTLPSGLNLKTWWPLPSFPSPSVTHTFPSLSTQMPWGNTNMPAPKLLKSLPDGSNSRMGDRFEPAQLFAPHRSATHMRSFESTSTAAVDPQLLPSGSFAQPSTTR